MLESSPQTSTVASESFMQEASAALLEHLQPIGRNWLNQVQLRIPGRANRSTSLVQEKIPSDLKALANKMHRRAEDAERPSHEPVFRAPLLKNFPEEALTPHEVIAEYWILYDEIVDFLGGRGLLNNELRSLVSDYIRDKTTETVRALSLEVDNQSYETQSVFELLVKELKDYAIFVLDPKGIVVNWNEGATRIKGYSAEEVIGQPFNILYLEEDSEMGRPQNNLLFALRDGRHQEMWWRRRKDGSTFWADITLTPIYDSNGKHLGFSKVVKDLTEKKRADEELKAAKEAAEAASELKSAFLANMSHEIRTPLGAILGFTEMLDDPTLTEAERSAHREVISRNGKVLTRLIEDILDLSKVEAGKLDVQYFEVPLRSLMPEVIGVIELKAREKSIPIQLHIQEEVPNYVVTDPVRLRQILNNVIGNAVKFTDNGHVAVKVELKQNLIGSTQVRILVKDTGPGIPKHLQDKLFKPFAQADESSTRRFGGTGLGLALSRKLARELGGDITIFDCPVGEGCSFEITFKDKTKEKLAVPSQNHRTAPDEHTSVSAKILLGKQILLVEDSKDNQVLIARILERAGATVAVAGNGAEGFDKAMSRKFDAVLMDIQMPVLDGLAATKKLRETGFNQPIIALTAHAMNEHRTLCMNSGFDDHLSKPINSSELIGRLLKHVGASQSSEVL